MTSPQTEWWRELGARAAADAPKYLARLPSWKGFEEMMIGGVFRTRRLEMGYVNSGSYPANHASRRHEAFGARETCWSCLMQMAGVHRKEPPGVKQEHQKRQVRRDDHACIGN